MTGLLNIKLQASSQAALWPRASSAALLHRWLFSPSSRLYLTCSCVDRAVSRHNNHFKLELNTLHSHLQVQLRTYVVLDCSVSITSANSICQRSRRARRRAQIKKKPLLNPCFHQHVHGICILHQIKGPIFTSEWWCEFVTWRSWEDMRSNWSPERRTTSMENMKNGPCSLIVMTCGGPGNGKTPRVHLSQLNQRFSSLSAHIFLEVEDEIVLT